MPDKSGIPERISEIYEPIKQDLIWLHCRWEMFRQVFGSGKSNIDLVNYFAPVFFRACQDALFDHVILGICRLTDPKTIGNRKTRKETGSLERLLVEVDPMVYPELRVKLQTTMKDIRRTCKPLRAQRHSRIAHYDIRTPKSRTTSLPSRKMIEDALETIRQFMNDISGYFEDSQTLFTPIIHQGNGKDLIRHLSRLRTLRVKDPHVNG